MLTKLTSILKPAEKGTGKSSAGKLEKASIVIYGKRGARTKVLDKIPVQFNPAEYSISRGARMADKHPLARDPEPSDLQAVGGLPAILSVSLHFDSYTPLSLGGDLAARAVKGLSGAAKNRPGGDTAGKFPSFDMNEEVAPQVDQQVNRLCQAFQSLIKVDNEEHEPSQVGFLWGEYLHFIGSIEHHTVTYTMFDRDGTPVRARMDLSIRGEEKAYLTKGYEYPKESPDRTKQRLLTYGDQLWMMAQEEYGDPARWKTIAAANGILNPRKLEGAQVLKVPSIR